MRRVVYLLSGPAHAMNVVCSVRSLRTWWNGPVDIFTWPESHDFVHRMTKDNRLDVSEIPWNPLYRGHSDTYVDKTRLIQSLPIEDSVLFLDADTLVCGKLDRLFDAIDTYECVVTQFCDWVTTGGIISKRIKSLLEFPEIDPQLVDKITTHKYPSINTGIFGAMPSSQALHKWNEWTVAAKDTFIPDEKVMHLIVAEFSEKAEISVATGGRWNCSPMYQPTYLSDSDVVIWHFHGDSNVRPDKSAKGFGIWWPVFQSSLHMNLGGMAEWIGKINNRHLNELMK